MWDVFRPRLPRPSIPLPCTNWYGHSFVEAKSGTFIYCIHCGETRNPKEADDDR